MRAAVGALVAITYDARVDIEPGHALVTLTGRTYVIASCRQQTRGRHVGRWHLRCVVTDQSPPPGVPVHTIRWYKRARAKGASR